jgi:hypothetical protein
MPHQPEHQPTQERDAEQEGQGGHVSLP